MIKSLSQSTVVNGTERQALPAEGTRRITKPIKTPSTTKLSLSSKTLEPPRSGIKRSVLLIGLLLLAVLGGWYWFFALSHDKAEPQWAESEPPLVSTDEGDALAVDTADVAPFKWPDNEPDMEATETETFIPSPLLADDDLIDNDSLPELWTNTNEPIIEPPPMAVAPPPLVQESLPDTTYPQEDGNKADTLPDKPYKPKLTPVQRATVPTVIVKPTQEEALALSKLATVHVCSDTAGDVYFDDVLVGYVSGKAKFKVEPREGSLYVEIRPSALFPPKKTNLVGPIGAGMTYRIKHNCD